MPVRGVRRADRPGLRRTRIAGFLFGMLALLTLDDARSQDMHKLDEVQRQLEKSRERETALTRQAKELEQEVAALRREMIQAARAAQEHEALLSSLEGRLDDQIGRAHV